MVDCLFAYGTLLVPELLSAIVGRAIEGRPAILTGYVCRRVHHAAYPAIMPRAGESTLGQVYFGIDETQWRHLDAFESDQYERRLVAVSLPGGSHTTAYTYRLADAYKRHLTDEVWDIKHFRRHHLKRYLTEFTD